MNRFLHYILTIFLLTSTALVARTLDNETLITIHGIFGSSWNMSYITSPLKEENMAIFHWDYPSRDKTIHEHAADLVLLLQQEAQKNPGKPIHFLTHSMGGLVLRAAVNHPDCPREAHIGKAVLLAPPNQGAAWGRFLGEFSLVRYIGKDKAGKELCSEQNFEHLGQFPPSMEVLIIAGNLSLNPFLEGENDGRVTVKETYLSTPHRHIVLKWGHKSLLASDEAALQAKNFFKED